MAEGVNDLRDRPEEIDLAVERFSPKICHRRQVLRMELSHYGVEAMPQPESFPIDKIYVPVKRKKALKPELVQEIAESILEIGQQRQFSFGPTKAGSFWSRDCIGSKPARPLAKNYHRGLGLG